MFAPYNEEKISDDQECRKRRVDGGYKPDGGYASL